MIPRLVFTNLNLTERLLQSRAEQSKHEALRSQPLEEQNAATRDIEWCGMPRSLRRGAAATAGRSGTFLIGKYVRETAAQADVLSSHSEERGAATGGTEQWCGMPRSLWRGAAGNAAR
jgi:hypothetical protein